MLEGRTLTFLNSALSTKLNKNPWICLKEEVGKMDGGTEMAIEMDIFVMKQVE